MYKDLKNKSIIITGGSGFLGSQFSEAFLKQDSKIIILDLKKPKINHKNCFFLNCDITSEKKVKKALFIIKKKYKYIDVLINNAAIDSKPSYNKKNSLENFNIKTWERDLNIGLKGAFIATKFFGTAMSKQKNGGTIINISSDLGIIAPDQRIYENMKFVKPVTYSVVKHGIIGLTKYVASYWAKKKIRCNAIAPGGMINNQDKSFIKRINKLIPLARLANRNEYNNAILFLASNASSYMTGSVLVIDGGRTII